MPTPLLHQSDLFRPHEDPDDHWDLACVYALAHAGDLDLRGVLIDHPPADHVGSPDVIAIAQLNHLTGLTVPMAVGSSVAVSRCGERPEHLGPSDRRGVDFVLRTLADSPTPVGITIVGSCRDIALAGAADPELFRQKCIGIYLNAGSGTRQLETLGELEYNVALNPAAYGTLFALPCPLYWMPCFEYTPSRWEVEEYGSFYRFTQSEIIPHLSPRLQGYFTSVLSRSPSVDWLRALHEPHASALLNFGSMPRNMWCTAGFFHAAGQAVTLEGEIVPLDVVGDRAAYTYDPIEATCDDEGTVRWNPASAGAATAVPRHIFHVRDRGRYAAAMTRAMRTLLRTLP